MSDIPLSQDCARTLTEHDLQQTVNAYWEADYGWRWHEVSNLLFASNLLKLSTTVLNPQRVHRDTMHWLNVEGVSQYDPHISWQWGGLVKDNGKLIRKLRVQQGVKVFVWMLAHGRIPTIFLRWRMDIADNSDCSRCNGERMDALHVSVDCKCSGDFWDCLQPTCMLVGFFSLEHKDWILQSLRFRGWSSWVAEWPEVMAIASWNLWKSDGIMSCLGMRSCLCKKRLEQLQHIVEEMIVVWNFTPDTVCPL